MSDINLQYPETMSSSHELLPFKKLTKKKKILIQPRFCCVLTYSWSLNVIEGTSWNATPYTAGEQRAWIPFPCSFTNATGYSLHRQTALILQIRPLVRFSTIVAKYASRGCISTNKRSRNPLDFLWRCFIHGSVKCMVNCNHGQNAI